MKHDEVTAGLERALKYLTAGLAAHAAVTEAIRLLRTPAADLRIDNLRKIAADETVNPFARAICSEAATELRRLREVEHLAWHMMESSAEDAVTGKVVIEPLREDYDKLCALLPEGHPEQPYE